MNLRHLQRLSVVFLVLLVALCSWYGPITEVASSSVDDGLKRSLVSFASARALNGVISVLQGTEVAVQPVGIGVSLSIGEILDPINDLVESLSSVMLMASVAFGIQKLLLTIGSNWMVSAFVTGVALLWSWLFVRGRVPRGLTGLLVVLLFARFVMPVTLIGSASVFEHFSAEDYQQSQAVLDTTSDSLKGFALTDLVKDPAGSVKAKYEALKTAAEAAAERMIHLIVVFLMQTVMVPLLLLWALYRLTAGLLGFARAAPVE